MSENNFTDFDSLGTDSNAAFEKLVEQLKQTKNYHALFDAILMRKKHELGLSLARPGSLEDVPSEHQPALEETYIDAARTVGQMLLDDGKIGEAWVYFRTIREPEPVRKAIEALEVDTENFEDVEQLVNVCLYEGAHPVKGLELLLKTHGTCNTVTATDQHLTSMTDDERKQVAAMLVTTLYADLKLSVLTDVRRKIPTEDDNKSLKELLVGREWLFEDNNYHIDVSHLNAVVRFARALDESCTELPLAIELATYGRNLAEPLQYPAEPPFDQFYEAHLHYFRVLAGQNPDQSLAWFRKRLANEQDQQDQQMTAYVLVDLLRRIDKLDDAVHFAAEHLQDLNDPQGFSFAALCHEAGAFDKLKAAATKKDDLLSYVSAVLAESNST
ncbi:MAG: hypothetical protein AB8G99_15390 [Planctomycetaceae bacterium]